MERGTVKAWTGEAVCGLALAATGAVFAIGGRRMSLFEDGVPGPGLVPFIAGLLLVGLGFVIAASAVRARSEAPVRLFDRDSLIAAGLMFAAIVAFEAAGYLVSTFLFLWASFVLVGREPAVVAGLIAGAATLLTWGLFVKALGVGLPAGIFRLF